MSILEDYFVHKHQYKDLSFKQIFISLIKKIDQQTKVAEIQIRDEVMQIAEREIIQNKKKWEIKDLIEINSKMLQEIKKGSNDQLFNDLNKKMENFYKYMQKMILETEYKPLQEMAQYYLTNQGKLVRPNLNLLMGEFLFNQKYPGKDFFENEIYNKQKVWGSVIELLHISSLIHDDIIDNALSRRGLSAAHLKFGKKNATFSANFIIGRSGRKISELNNLQMFNIFSQIMDDLTAGEFIQADQSKKINNNNLVQKTQDYMTKTYYKTASLMAHSLRGVALLNDEDVEQQEKCFKFGANIGIAFQLIDDVLDYVSDSKSLGKSSFADLKEGNITGPVLFSLHENILPQEEKIIQKILLKQNISDQDVEQVYQIILKYHGIEKTTYLAILHSQKALSYILNDKNQNDKTIQIFRSLIANVITRVK